LVVEGSSVFRKLAVWMDASQLDANGDCVSGAAGENLDRQLGDLQEMSDENAEGEGMDIIILGCMMPKDRQWRQ
jgi:hypothetical protein